MSPIQARSSATGNAPVRRSSGPARRSVAGSPGSRGKKRARRRSRPGSSGCYRWPAGCPPGAQASGGSGFQCDEPTMISRESRKAERAPSRSPSCTGFRRCSRARRRGVQDAWLATGQEGLRSTPSTSGDPREEGQAPDGLKLVVQFKEHELARSSARSRSFSARERSLSARRAPRLARRPLRSPRRASSRSATTTAAAAALRGRRRRRASGRACEPRAPALRAPLPQRATSRGAPFARDPGRISSLAC